MDGARYLEVLNSINNLAKHRFSQSFPTSTAKMHTLMENAGFSPHDYRASWPDLIQNLPGDAWSAQHFVKYMEADVKLLRRFPISIDFAKLQALVSAPMLSRVFKCSLLRSLIQAQIDYQPASLEDPGFWRDVVRLLSRVGRPVLIFGDSHSLIYRQTVKGMRNNTIIPLTVLCGGGSASGLPNALSRSGYGNMIKRTVAALDACVRLGSSPIPILFGFGQVDLEFVHTYKRLREGTYSFDEAAIDAFSRDFSSRYTQWVADLRLPKAVILGVNPPCIDDEYIRESYWIQMQVYTNGHIVDGRIDSTFDELRADFDALTFPSKARRTFHHRRLNELLSGGSAACGLAYADTFTRMVGDDGCINPAFACASDGEALQVGLTGKDIHIGGEHARKAKARLLRSIP